MKNAKPRMQNAKLGFWGFHSAFCILGFAFFIAPTASLRLCVDIF
jgi:hypothetical protein